MNGINKFFKYIIDFLIKASKIFVNYFVGKTVTSLILGLVSYAIMELIDIRFSWIIAILVFITNYIPTIGPICGAIISGLIVVFQQPIFALWVVLIFIGVQLLDGWVLGPIFLGKSVGISPLIVIIALVLGGAIFGIPGVILAVPVAGVIKLLFVKDKKDEINRE